MFCAPYTCEEKNSQVRSMHRVQEASISIIDHVDDIFILKQSKVQKLYEIVQRNTDNSTKK